MSLFDMIGSILIGPLKLIFEVIFSLAYKVLNHPGLAIIVLSFVMNILVLPLYRRADAIQMEARDTENKLKDTVAHIKATFSGDERMMILQTYYRQNNYNPLSVLSGSISLLLEIPFFMAAYQFLSGLDVFSGVSLGLISDLSVPDGLLVIGGFSINVLPFIMTFVNVISSALYLKGFPLKTKLQLYGMALFFLVFLYNSPAALVFYWTLNNLFSLFKTLFYKIENPKSILTPLISIAGIAAFVIGVLMDGIYRSAFMICLGIICQIPLLIPVLKKYFPAKNTAEAPRRPNTKLFFLGGIFLTVLIGLLIPSAFIAASPQEYINTNYFYNPIWYVIHTLCLSGGIFLVWLSVFYWLANDKFKILFTQILWVLCGVCLVNYMFFGTNLGILSPDLLYTEGFYFSLKEHIINIAVIIAVVVSFMLLMKKAPKIVSTVLLVGSIAIAAMGAVNTVTIAASANETKARIEATSGSLPSFNLDKNGQNVVVIMLDRAMGPFVPYIFEEKPELYEQFDGFTYYENTLSFGGFTNFATPSLYGGYEYTPLQINLRDTEKLVDKHNEAIKVIPTIFSNADYKVTLIDPSYAGYQWIPDLSIYEDIENVTAYHADGRFNDYDALLKNIDLRKRNFFFFSFMKTLPVTLQDPVYNNGAYRAIPTKNESVTVSATQAFMNAYNVMENLNTMTGFTENGDNTYMFFRSNVTHEAVILQEPDYVPVESPDNSAYHTEGGKRITAGEESLLLTTENQISHYHINMKALMQLGEWLDYLKDNDVYDNTRIIIVADHGRGIGAFDSDSSIMHDIDFYRPILLVKDFDSHGFTTSDAFMTNADVPTIATEALIPNPVNPFTGNPIDSSYKEENDKHYVIASIDWDVNKNNGYQFLPSEWATVSGEVGIKENWTFSEEVSVLPPDYED